MGKGTFIALVALLVALAGTIVAFAAYFKRRSSVIYDDFDEDIEDDDADDELDYYATQVDEDEPLEDEQPTEEPEAAPTVQDEQPEQDDTSAQE
ncbi:MAG: hypothetical protein HFG20_01570 [Anaerotruncus sp.]|nr:hypothetical protein [Anaerotruncus sp.]